MNVFLISGIVLLLGVILGGFFVWVLSKKKTPDDKGSFLLLQNQLNELSRTLNNRLGESQKMVHEAVKEQFGESQKLIKEITKELTHVKEGQRHITSVGEGLRSLQQILQNPKQRGVLGEYYLETVLKNVLPPGHFSMQYKFEDGEIVDAVVYLDKNRILPVDSKFSLENYNKILEATDTAERERLEKVFKQDLKNRIDETAKYIRPKEGTLDHAFMFIPSEAIYYDLLVNKVGSIKTSTRDLIEYAFVTKHVVIVSPTTFLAYLQTVLQGLKALQIEEKAEEIIKRVGELGKHIGAYEGFMQKLGASLGTTVNHYNTAHKELKKIDKDVVRISGDSPRIEPVVLERPSTEE